MLCAPSGSTLFPYTTLFRSMSAPWGFNTVGVSHGMALADLDNDGDLDVVVNNLNQAAGIYRNETTAPRVAERLRSEEHTSELQSHSDLVCRLLLEKKKNKPS